MSATPKISVCMAMYNAASYLRECVDSILDQTFDDFELLIVDDGSTDNSADIARSYSDPRIRLVCRRHDFIASLNTLLTEARGRYIARMDADDIMMPDRLQRQHDYLETHHEVAAVCSQAVRVDSSGQPIGHIGSGLETLRITPRMMCESNHVCNPSSMMRRAIVDRGMRYEGEYEYAEDYRFWSRVVAETGPIDCLPQRLLHYRVSDTQVTATHWDEMMAATERIKSDLIAALVDKSNSGYTDPAINESGRDLTLIIPFLNEGEEVENTVRSFREFGGDRMEIIVINDCSYDSYPYMERLTAIPGVTYILNRKRLGVAASRDKGVELCHTPYFLLLDAHMRAYNDSWLNEIPRLLRENDRRILCCQTRVLTYNETKHIIEQNYKKFFGARLTFTTTTPTPGIEWITTERYPYSDYEIIPAILGAGYGVSKRYWNQISGLRGLRQYGSDEQMLSLKTWLEGGECILLKKVVLGHIYRSQMPYSCDASVSLQNSLIISESLFPLKDKCKARANSYIANRQAFIPAYSQCSKIIESDPRISNWCESAIVRTLKNIKQINRISSSLENILQNNVENRLPDILNMVLHTKAPDSGIFEGKAAYAVWLFHYAKHSNSDSIYYSACRLIGEAIHECDYKDFSFKSGLAGIGWALWYLHSVGMIETLPSEIDNINQSVSQYVHAADPLTCDLSFSNGLSGALAYYCIMPSRGIETSLQRKLNKIASIVLTYKKDITITEAFYAFIWQELNKQPNTGNIPQWDVSDWIISQRLLVKDANFWKLSLFDGVLATSISFL